MSRANLDIKKVGIVGGGVIGLSIAHQLLKRGISVSIFEAKQIGQGSTHAAAGMLLPTSETSFEDLDMYRLSTESLQIWEEYHKELELESGLQVDFRTGGSIMLAHDRDSSSNLKRLHAFQKKHSFASEWLSASELRKKEELISPKAVGGVYCPNDRQVDPRKVMLALEETVRKLGASIQTDTAIDRVEEDKEGLRVQKSNQDSEQFDTVVLAAGVGSGHINVEGVTLPSIRPVKGQMLEMLMSEDLKLSHLVEGDGAYLVPKAENRLLIGATTEEKGFEKGMTVGGVYRLMESARDLVPAIEEMKLTDMWYGFRPATIDNKAAVGWTDMQGLFFASGHYRNGVLLAPVTAREASKMILDGYESELLDAFQPSRFNSEEIKN